MAAVLNNVIPFSLFGYAEQRIPSALAGICNASAPLFAALVAFAMLPDERLSPRRRALGLVTGFAGVFVVLGAWTGLDGHDLTGTLLALGGGLCYGHRLPLHPPVPHRAPVSPACPWPPAQLLCATVVLAVRHPAADQRARALAGHRRALRGAAGRPGHRHRLPAELRHHLGRGRDHRDHRGYLLPLVSVLAGIVVLGERLTWNEPAGAAIIVAGAALTQLRSGSRRAARADPVPDAGVVGDPAVPVDAQVRAERA